MQCISTRSGDIAQPEFDPEETALQEELSPELSETEALLNEDEIEQIFEEGVEPPETEPETVVATPL